MDSWSFSAIFNFLAGVRPIRPRIRNPREKLCRCEKVSSKSDGFSVIFGDFQFFGRNPANPTSNSESSRKVMQESDKFRPNPMDFRLISAIFNFREGVRGNEILWGVGGFSAGNEICMGSWFKS